MKRNKFILINSVIIFFMTALFAYAVDVKSMPASPNSVKTVPAVNKVPAKSQAQPTPVAANVPVQGLTQPVTAAANAPVQNQAPPANTATVATDQNKTTPVPALPSASGDNYKYDPLNKPDPFQPFIVPEAVEKKKAEKKAPDSIFPLQRAEADSYRVVGIAGTEGHRAAIVEDAAKKFYPLVKGTRIGLYNGKVVEIMSDRVIVEEYEDKKAKRVILKLRKN